MCGTCGCGNGHSPDHEHYHNHNHEHHHHDHHHDHGESSLIAIEQDILQKNNLLAERNRGYFDAKRIFCLNIMSSPGAGKTTMLEETIRRLSPIPMYVIEGDQQTSNDANRIKALHVEAYQVNTGTGCHLDAAMINHALKHLNPCDCSIVFIENVGNLVCPAMFDLGEAKKVVIISTPEGVDKPLKYPYMFQEADICIINKIDLLPYVNVDIRELKENALKVNPRLQLFETSATTGEGVDAWCSYLTSQLEK